MLFSIWDLEIVLLLKPSWLRLRAATAAAAIWRPSLSLILLRSKCYGILAPISGNLTSYAQWWSLKARITYSLSQLETDPCRIQLHCYLMTPVKQFLSTCASLQHISSLSHSDSDARNHSKQNFWIICFYVEANALDQNYFKDLLCSLTYSSLTCLQSC